MCHNDTVDPIIEKQKHIKIICTTIVRLLINMLLNNRKTIAVRQMALMPSERLNNVNKEERSTLFHYHDICSFHHGNPNGFYKKAMLSL